MLRLWAQYDPESQRLCGWDYSTQSFELKYPNSSVKRERSDPSETRKGQVTPWKHLFIIYSKIALHLTKIGQNCSVIWPCTLTQIERKLARFHIFGVRSAVHTGLCHPHLKWPSEIGSRWRRIFKSELGNQSTPKIRQTRDPEVPGLSKFGPLKVGKC